MSEMQYNKGIVQELFNNIVSPLGKAKELAKKLGVKEEDLFHTYDGDEDYIEFRNDYYRQYVFANGRLFDVSGAPDTYYEDEERDYVKYLGDGKYEVDFIYYNGGADFAEMFTPYLEKQELGLTEASNDAFYAIKFNNGTYWSRGHNTSPSMFMSEGKALGVANSVNVRLDPDSYKIVRFVEQ